MNKRRLCMTIIILAILLGACQGAGATETAAPTATQTPTVIPPTETPLPSPTSVPPTPTRHTVLSLHEWADLGTGMGPVFSQDWSPDGMLLVTADTELIRVWEVNSRREHSVLSGHSGFIWGLAWSPPTPEGTSLLASSSQDGTVRIWDVAAGVELAVFQTGWGFCVDWSPDGQRITVGTYEGEVQVWEVASQQMLSSWRSPTHSMVISIGWSPDGSTIATGELNGIIHLWDAASGEVLQTIDGYTPERCDANGLAWSPDGSQIATAHQDGFVRLWDPTNGQLILAIDGHTGFVRGLAWAPDGSLLASTGQDKRIVLWDPVSGLAYAEQHHNHLPVWSVSWSPDGTMVASGAGAYLERHVGATIVWQVP